MNLVPRDSVTDFSRFIDEFFAPSRVAGNNGKAFFAPQVDIESEEDHYVIHADMPGVSKEDIQVTLEDGILTLEAQRSEAKSEEKAGKVLRRERRFGKFSRSFHVPRNITVEEVKGSFDNGVLTLSVPKESQHAPANQTVAIN